MVKRLYPDHGSPVRAARITARQKLPCPDCASESEPTIRRARPFTVEWEAERGAFFGCRDCGRLLASLSGPSAMRPSDRTLDHVPDPEGVLARVLEDEPARLAINRMIRSEGGLPDPSPLDHIYPGLALRADLTVTFETRPLLVIELEGLSARCRSAPDTSSDEN